MIFLSGLTITTMETEKKMKYRYCSYQDVVLGNNVQVMNMNDDVEIETIHLEKMKVRVKTSKHNNVDI